MIYTSKVTGPWGSITHTHASQTRAVAWVRMALRCARGMDKGEVSDGSRVVKTAYVHDPALDRKRKRNGLPPMRSMVRAEFVTRPKGRKRIK